MNHISKSQESRRVDPSLRPMPPEAGSRPDPDGQGKAGCSEGTGIADASFRRWGFWKTARGSVSKQLALLGVLRSSLLRARPRGVGSSGRHLDL